MIVWRSCFVAERPWVVEWDCTRFVVGLGYLGVVASAGASWAWYRLLETDDLVPLNAITLLTPALSVLLAWFLYQETITGTTWAGVVAAVVGVAVVGLPPKPAWRERNVARSTDVSGR